jgi:hypothetical protein
LHRTLIVYLMSLDLVPPSLFLFPCLLHLSICFGVLLYYFLFVSVFFWVFFFFFFAISAGLFLCLHHDKLPPCSSLYRVSVHAISFFPCISFCLYSVLLFFFSLYFVCYLLVTMFWPRWFNWIPFDPDLCVMDVYVTLTFKSRRKNSPDFYIVDECVSWLNC